MQSAGIVIQAFSQRSPPLRGDDGQRLPCGRHRGWTWRGREDVGTACQAQGGPLGMWSCGKAAHAGKALAEGAHHHVHALQHAFGLGLTTATRAQHTEGMRLIHHQQGTMALLDRHDLGDGCGISHHAVEPLDDHRRSTSPWSQTTQTPVQVVGVIVTKGHDIGAAEPGAIVNTGMGLGIQHHHVTGQRGDHTQIGQIPGGKHGTGWKAKTGRQLLFQSAVARKAAIGHPRARGSRALFAHRLAGGVLAGGIEAQPKIIVAAKKRHRPALPQGFRCRKRSVELHGEGVHLSIGGKLQAHGLEFLETSKDGRGLVLLIFLHQASRPCAARSLATTAHRSPTVSTSPTAFMGMVMSK